MEGCALGQVLHGNATTTEAVSVYILNGSASKSVEVGCELELFVIDLRRKRPVWLLCRRWSGFGSVRFG
jgi:hypothetical protein